MMNGEGKGRGVSSSGWGDGGGDDGIGMSDDTDGFRNVFKWMYLFKILFSMCTLFF